MHSHVLEQAILGCLIKKFKLGNNQSFSSKGSVKSVPLDYNKKLSNENTLVVQRFLEFQDEVGGNKDIVYATRVLNSVLGESLLQEKDALSFTKVRFITSLFGCLGAILLLQRQESNLLDFQ